MKKESVPREKAVMRTKKAAASAPARKRPQKKLPEIEDNSAEILTKLHTFLDSIKESGDEDEQEEEVKM